MNKKTIKIILTKKLEEWTKTITDKQLANDTLHSAIVTGGCIVSMQLNEKVNDYDIYIEDKAVLLRLMKYYTKNIDSVIILDGNKKDEYLDKLEYDENGYSIIVNNLEKDQLKFYVESGNGLEMIKKTDAEYNGKYEIAYISPNAISLSDDIQIVCRFHGDAEQIHTNYDFVHATNYFTFDKGLQLNEKAQTSIISKTLYYTGSKYPVTSIIRMKKFLKRGWNINAGEILKMVYQASLLDLTDVSVLEEQLIGVDIAYFDSLIDAMSSIKDDKKNSSVYLFDIIDKIFND